MVLRKALEGRIWGAAACRRGGTAGNVKESLTSVQPRLEPRLETRINTKGIKQAVEV